MSHFIPENLDKIKKFDFKNHKEEIGNEQKTIVDESQINNYLKDAWKELENLDAKVANFKTNIMKVNPVKSEVTSNILNKLKEKEADCKIYFLKLVKDHSKVMGFGTNRVVGKQLNKTNLTSSQINNMNMLKNLCDVKKQPSNSVIEEKKQEDNEKKVEKRPSRLKNLMSMDLIEETRDCVKNGEEIKQICEETLTSEVVKNE